VKGIGGIVGLNVDDGRRVSIAMGEVAVEVEGEDWTLYLRGRFFDGRFE